MNRNLRSPNPRDRRREARRSAGGTVRLQFEDPLPRTLDLELMDISTSGFRAAHQHGGLACGQEVLFRHPHGAGSARVVWNVVRAEHVETGFMVLSLER